MSNRGDSDNHWRQLRRSLLQAAVRFTKGVGDAEDLVHASFERFLHMRTHAPGADARLADARAYAPLLHTIMRRLAIDRVRRQRRWRFDEALDLLCDAADERDSCEDMPLLDAAKLDELLQELTPYDRALFELRHVHSLRYHAIAKQLSIPPGTVGTRLRRIRAQLSRRVRA